VTFSAGSRPGPCEILAPLGAGRTEDARLRITFVVGWVPEGKK
jgi:hypothetical protein